MAVLNWQVSTAVPLVLFGMPGHTQVKLRHQLLVKFHIHVCCKQMPCSMAYVCLLLCSARYRSHDLTTAGPSQDLIGLLEPEDEQQPANGATAATEAAAAARQEPASEAEQAKAPATVAATSPTAEKPAKRRPISSRLGPQPRSPVRSATPEQQQQQQQEDLQQPADRNAQTPEPVKATRSRSPTRSVSRGRSTSRSLSESSGSRGDKQRRSRSRSRSSSSHSRGQQDKSEGRAVTQDEELLDFGDEDEVVDAAAAVEDSQMSDERRSDKHRDSKRRSRHSSRKRSKHGKKEKKEKSGKKKRHKADRHRSRSRSRAGGLQTGCMFAAVCNINRCQCP